MYFRRNFKIRQVEFIIEDGRLVRITTDGSDSRDGRRYAQRCDMASLEAVAWAMQACPRQGAGLTVNQIAGQEKLPTSQVDVALEFLWERGIIVTRHKRRYPACDSVHTAAMCEFYALAEEPRPT